MPARCNWCEQEVKRAASSWRVDIMASFWTVVFHGICSWDALHPIFSLAARSCFGVKLSVTISSENSFLFFDTTFLQRGGVVPTHCSKPPVPGVFLIVTLLQSYLPLPFGSVFHSPSHSPSHCALLGCSQRTHKLLRSLICFIAS